MSERSGAREWSESCGASEQVSDAIKRANGRANGPVLTSRFLAVLNHSAIATRDAEAEAEAVTWVSRFRIRGWVSY